MPDFKIAVFADNEVGVAVVHFILTNYEDDIKYIICTDKNSKVYSEFKDRLDLVLLTSDNLKTSSVINSLKTLDYFILAWWPHIIKNPLLSLPKKGIINFHPSLLPYNRGKHYNFWTIVEGSPFGVSLQFIDNTIDGGDIIFQKTMSKDWTDTGRSLYFKAQTAMLELFIDSYHKIRNGNYERKKQDLTKGSFHLANELENACFIDLNKDYKAADLLNIIRAKTFKPHSGAWFMENDIRYEVLIEIKKITNN